MRFLKTSSLIVFVSFQPLGLFAASGTEGNTFLNIPVGAGPAALGSAYSASAIDAYAPVWNPAGLAFVNGWSVAAQHLSYVESIRYEQASLAYHPTSSSAWGASVQYLTTGDIPQTNGVGDAIGNFSASYVAYSLAYAYRVSDRLAVGITGRYTRATLASVSAGSVSGDAGVLWEITPTWRAAFTLNHVGSAIRFLSESDPQPTQAHAALSYHRDSGFMANVEAVRMRSGLTSGRLGIEMPLFQRVRIRAGYRTDALKENGSLAGVTTGLGVLIHKLEFAYAWVPLGELGFTQYFSVIGRFGGEEKLDVAAERKAAKQSKTHTAQRNSTKEEDDPMELYQLLQQDLFSSTKEDRQ